MPAKRSSARGMMKLMLRLRKDREVFEEEEKLFEEEDHFLDRRHKNRPDRRRSRLSAAIPTNGDRRRHDRRHLNKVTFERNADWYLNATIEIEEHEIEDQQVEDRQVEDHHLEEHKGD